MKFIEIKYDHNKIILLFIIKVIVWTYLNIYWGYSILDKSVHTTIYVLNILVTFFKLDSALI